VESDGFQLLNSVRITIPGAIVSTFLGSLNGYVFAKWGFRGSNVILFLFVFGLFLPGQGILIPLVWVLQFMGLYGKVNGLIMAYCIFGIPITSLLFYRYYASVPDELVDAQMRVTLCMRVLLEGSLCG